MVIHFDDRLPCPIVWYITYKDIHKLNIKKHKSKGVNILKRVNNII